MVTMLKLIPIAAIIFLIHFFFSFSLSFYLLWQSAQVILSPSSCIPLIVTHSQLPIKAMDPINWLKSVRCQLAYFMLITCIPLACIMLPCVSCLDYSYGYQESQDYTFDYRKIQCYLCNSKDGNSGCEDPFVKESATICKTGDSCLVITTTVLGKEFIMRN